MNVRLGGLAGLVLAASLLAAPTAAEAARPPSGPNAGGAHPVTELTGQYDLPKLKEREVLLTVSKWGLRYVGGGVGNDLSVSEVDGEVLYVDRSADRWKSLPSVCRRVPVERGVGAQCRVPSKFEDRTMFLEVYPRLGDDRTDASTMSDRFRMWVLTDAGKDSVRTGAGDDFINTAFQNDSASAGAGDDWVRVGSGRNRIDGGPGRDYLTGGPGRDAIRGGEDDDALYGGTGSDRLTGDEGDDTLNGGPGRDTAVRDRGDRVRKCEVSA